MKQKKVILFAVAILCLIAGITGFYLYNKPRATAATEKTQITIAAKALFQAFATDEQHAEKKFGGKILEVTGTVADVQPTGSSFSVLLSGDSTGIGGINCAITDSTATKPAQGETITIKGRCTGFLMDVTLSDASMLPIQ